MSSQTRKNSRAEQKERIRAQSASNFGSGSSHEVLGLDDSRLEINWKDMNGNEHSTTWINGVCEPEVPDFTGESFHDVLIQTVLTELRSSSISFFRLFWTSDITELIVRETNKYAATQSASFRSASSEEQGYGKRPRLAPTIAVDYNEAMGGVDTNDHLRNCCTFARRAKKPYMPIFYWIVDAAVSNAWLIFRLHNTEAAKKKNARRDFHLGIGQELSCLSSNIRELRAAEFHSIERVSSIRRRNCEVCLGAGKKLKTAFRCRRCDVWLHIQTDCIDTCYITHVMPLILIFGTT